MRIYLDACCVCRPFDDSSIERNRIEAEAVLSVLSMVEQEKLTWIASTVLLAELSQTMEDERRENALTMISIADEVGSTPDRQQTEGLISLGFKPLDAMHLSAAIQSKCEAFLSTDDRLLRTARRNRDQRPLVVSNPLAFLAEQFDDHDSHHDAE